MSTKKTVSAKKAAPAKTKKPPLARADAASQAKGAKAAAGACKSRVSNTAGCMLDCSVGDINLALQAVPNMGTVRIVSAEYPPGTAVTFTATTINFSVKAGVQDLVVGYFFAPASSRAKLVESCDNQTVWDSNINSTMAVARYTVCA